MAFFVEADIKAVGSNQILEFELLSENQLDAAPMGKAVVIHSTDQGLGLMIQEGPQQAGIRELYSWLLRRHRKWQGRAAGLASFGNGGSWRG